MRNVCLTICILGGCCLPAHAGEIEDAANEGIKLYKMGSLKEAAAQWDYAATLARQEIAQQVAELLPGPLPGWSLEDGGNEGFGGGMFGGGVSVQRSYRKEAGDESVELQLMSDNPMMQSMSMMFANPSMAAMSGMKFRTVAGQRALLQDKGQDYELIFSLRDGKAMLMIEASGGDAAANAEAYAEAIDFKALNEK